MGRFNHYLIINNWLLKQAKCQPHEIVITMESTGIYHEAIALVLPSSGFQIIISNPGKAKKFSQSLGLVHKTDKLDSYMLARYGDAQYERVLLSIKRMIIGIGRGLTASLPPHHPAYGSVLGGSNS
ncbi:transposase [Photobacterium carnosum]|uniref:IS110 family transposase n=1 Tax=Photobacterium carnosum TaxID=2023717 RepID=UPI0039F6866E|nr:transposase [Photobacterium carnosum]MCD9528349.1 transposase [Photobacterium carnosum]